MIGEGALYVGAPQSFKSVDFAPKQETFAGFTLSAELITFRLDFKGKPGVDIGCGDIVIGDTLANGTQDLVHILALNLYRSRETHLRFDVTIPKSVFVFDGELNT